MHAGACTHDNVHVCTSVGSERNMYMYHSLPVKHSLPSKCPDSHFRGINGEHPFPGKCPGIHCTCTFVHVQFEIASTLATILPEIRS